MVGTIGPLVKVAPRTWLAAIAMYILGSLAGGAAIGAALGTAGYLLATVVPHSSAVWLAITALGVAYGLWELGVLPIDLPLPSRHRTTWRGWWTQLGPVPASLIWGLQLGSGVTTVVPYAAFYFLLVCLTALGSPPLGAAVMMAYGLSRAMPTVIGAVPIARGVPPRLVSEWGMRRQAVFSRMSATALIAVALLQVPWWELLP